MTSGNQKKLDNLLAWALENGAVINCELQFKHTANTGIAGFKTDRKSNQTESANDSNDAQIKIPTKIIITPQVVKEFFDEKFSGFIDALMTKSQYINSSSATKLFLSYSKFFSTSDFYSPYVNALPIGSSMPDSPLLWPVTDKKLLRSTNLGNSLEPKLIILIHEWYQVVSTLYSIYPLPEIEKDLQFYKEYFLNKGEVSQLCYVNLEKFHSQLASLVQDNHNVSWTSFESYLWSHLMMTSRSFPYHVIGETTATDQAILLPVVDLLNHRSNEKVEWSCEQINGNKFFCFKNDNFSQLSGEVFNNYGCKNNEELLLGYGFLIPDNEYDTCALKLKLPVDQLQDIHDQHTDLRLPIPEDYSNTLNGTFVSKLDTKFSDGLLYFLSKENPVPEELLQLFSLIVKNEYDYYFIDECNKSNQLVFTTRAKLEAIDQLTAAIEAKLSALELNPLKFSSVSTQREFIAATYIKSQKSIFNKSLKTLKKLSKSTLKLADGNSQILTLKKILNKDQTFQEALISVFDDPEQDIIGRLVAPETDVFHDPVETEELIEQVILLWLVRCSNKNFYQEYKIPSAAFDNVLPSYIFNLFLWFKIHKFKSTQFQQEEIAHFEEVHKSYFPMLAKAVPEVFAVGSWKPIDLVIAARILDLIRYVRPGKTEIYLIENGLVEV